jgi:hypothetical protein
MIEDIVNARHVFNIDKSWELNSTGIVVISLFFGFIVHLLLLC